MATAYPTLPPETADIEPLAHGPLPPTLQAAVAGSLRGGERVLWLGRPGRRAAAGLGQRLGGLVLLALAAAAVAFARDTLDSLNVDWRLPWLRDGLLLGSGLALAAPALLLAAVSLDVLARPRRLRVLLRRVAYVVTSARAMLVVEPASRGEPPRVRKYRRRAMRRAAVLPRGPGRGDVVLDAPARAGRAGQETDPILRQLLAGGEGFLDVQGAAEVHTLLRRVGGRAA